MSAQKVSCPKCKLILRLPANAVPNSVLKCSKCAAPFRVPAAAQKTAPKPAGVNLACPKCKKLLRVSATLAPATLVKCPHCQAAMRTPSAPAPVGRVSPNAGISKKAPVAIANVLQSQAAKKITENARKQWRDPKRRMVILAVAGGAAVMAAGVMLLMAVAVGWLLFARGGTSTELANNQPGAPANNQQPNPDGNAKRQPAQPNAGKHGIIKLVKSDGGAKPLPMDPKNHPYLVLDAEGHSSIVKRVMFTPNGKQVISVSTDRTIRIWDLKTAETSRVLRVPIGPSRAGSLFAGGLSPDGRVLAVGGMNTSSDKSVYPVYLISLETNRIQKALIGHKGLVTHVEFSPDGQWLASSSNDMTVRIWELKSGRTIHVLHGHNKLVRHVRFAPTRDVVATASVDGSVRVWSVSTGQQMASYRPATGMFDAVTWNCNGQYLIAGTDDGYLYVFDQNGRMRNRFTPHDGERVDFNFLTPTPKPEEVLFAGVGWGTGVNRGRFRGRCGIVNFAVGNSRLIVSDHDNVVQHGAVSPDGRLAVTTGGHNNPIFVWRTTDKQIVARLTGKALEVKNVGWSRDGKRIAWTNQRGGYFPKKGEFPTLRKSFSVSNFKKTKIHPGESTTSAVLKRDGWSLQLLNPQKLMIHQRGQPVANFGVKKQRMLAFTLLSNNRYAVGTDANGVILILDLVNGKNYATLFGHTGMVTGLAPSPDDRYLASCSDDSTICIWSLETYKLVMRLFMAEQDWIAWTPEGYYACSAFGERLMGWHVNNGRDKMATFHPAVRFRDSLYKPEAIKLLLQTGDIKQALLQAGEKKNAAQPLKLQHVLPPFVEIVSPTRRPNFKTGKKTIEVTAMAQSVGEHPVSALRLLLDGRPYKGDDGHLQLGDPKLGQIQGTWNVQLPPGEHVIAVQAESRVSKAVSRPLQVSCTSGSKPLPNLYVLAAGVSKYPGDLALKYAAADAIAIEKVFKEKTKSVFAKVDTLLVTDSAATKRGVYDGLKWLKKKMTAKDVGVIFFAGHGARDEFGKFYLVPVDIRPGSISESCISGDFVKRSLANIPGRLIAMFDACHSGAAAQKSRGFRAATDDLARDLVTEEYGVVVMCSSLGSEYSLESPLVKHGFFTVGLVKGLEGHADINKDSSVFLHELDRYAAAVVRTLSGGRQNPVTSRPATIRSFALSRR